MSGPVRARSRAAASPRTQSLNPYKDHRPPAARGHIITGCVTEPEQQVEDLTHGMPQLGSWEANHATEPRLIAQCPPSGRLDLVRSAPRLGDRVI